MFKRFFIICLTFLYFLTGCVSKNTISYLEQCEIDTKNLSLKISYFESEMYDSNWVSIKMEVTNKLNENNNVNLSNYYLYSEEDNYKYETSLRNSFGQFISNEFTLYSSDSDVFYFVFHIQRKINEGNYYFSVKINNKKYKMYLDY